MSPATSLKKFGLSDWAANIRADNDHAELSISDRTEWVTLVELSPSDAIHVLRNWPHHAAKGARIMRDAGVVDDLTSEAFAGLAGTCTVFRVCTATR